MKKFLKIFGLLCLFFWAFVFFLYLTFPYEVLKETVSTMVSKETGIRLSIGELSPKLPVGMHLKDIKIDTADGEAGIRLSSVTARVKFFPLFLLNLGIDSEITSGMGRIDIGADFSIIGFLSGEILPNDVNLMARKFPIDQISAFALKAAGKSPNANPMVAPILEQISIGGDLIADVDLDLNQSKPTLSKGTAKVRLANSKLILSHPSLGLPDQAFSKALIQADISGGKVVLSKQSGFLSDGLDLKMNGDVQLKPRIETSNMNMDLVVQLDKGLKDTFGFMIDRGKGTGRMNARITGPVGQPRFAPY